MLLMNMESSGLEPSLPEPLRQFFWQDFCDWYLKIQKLRLSPDSALTNHWRNLLETSGGRGPDIDSL
jgi:hypothetical protein